MYKNCYAVGIPHSKRKIGLLWATALGAVLKAPSKPLSIFQGINNKTLNAAEAMVAKKMILVEVLPKLKNLYIDVMASDGTNKARVVVSDNHTNVVLIEKNKKSIKGKNKKTNGPNKNLRAQLAKMSFDKLLSMSSKLTNEDRKRLRRGVKVNLKIARHGLKLFPKKFIGLMSKDFLTKISTLVCAGVYARMSGEDLPVMSMAGSGNKGIVCSIPLYLWGKRRGKSQKKIDEAIAFSSLITSVTTHYLGSLSAVCGCSNAAGIGLAYGLVRLEGGSKKELSLAIHNMVGNVTGMICDGAKIGCAMKTMTSVDAAFRAASLALNGIGIPVSDGIVAKDGIGSLKNLARIANKGMISTDSEILSIMKEKQSFSLS
jgi:L-cysteine desulfidase